MSRDSQSPEQLKLDWDVSGMEDETAPTFDELPGEAEEPEDAGVGHEQETDV